MKISIIIPAYNEAKNIAATLAALKTFNQIAEIIVVDDGSKDKTYEIAQRAGINRVIKLPQNRGKGGALNEALQFTSGDILVFLDADLGATAKEAAKLIDKVITSQADMAIGKLPANSPRAGFGLAIGLARWGIKYLTGRTFHAPLSGQRALNRQLMNKIGHLEPGFGVEVGLTIKAIKSGAKVLEVPVEMIHARTGRTLKGFYHRGKQFLAILKVILKNIFRKTTGDRQC